jgi:pyrimidine deaminase RibD-like protein
MSPGLPENIPVTLVTINGECFDVKLHGKGSVPLDNLDYYFYVEDKVKGRGVRKVSVRRFGPKDFYAQGYDARVGTALLNKIRRAFDSGELSFEAPDDPLNYKQITMEASDFAKPPVKSDSEIRQYITHKAFWLSYRYPRQPLPSEVLCPIPFDEAVDLDYLGASSADVLRNIQRLGNQGLLEKILDGNARPSEKLLQLYEPCDLKALGFSSAMSSQRLDNSDDRKWARLAVEEARKSISEQDGRLHPKVGAVVVKNGRVLSTAHRGEVLENHAEFIALERKLSNASVTGATVYTTLEPCTTRNHPKIPCAARLIERKVARVVIGMLDPDPRITGRGQRRLRSANIITDFFPNDLMTEVEELNREFTRKFESGSGFSDSTHRAVEPAAGNTRLSASLLELRGPALSYVVERPYGWEYLLFGQILQDELNALEYIKRDWQYGIAVGVGRELGPLQFLNWITEKIPEGLRISENLESLIEKVLPGALGRPGTSGDPQAILYVARRVAALYRNALEWKLDFKRIAVRDELIRLRSLASNLCDTLVEEIERWSRDYNDAVPKAIAASRTGEKTELVLTLCPSSPDLAEFTAELESVKRQVTSGKIPA